MKLPKLVRLILLAAPLFSAEGLWSPGGLVAHEWGTFTSVAGEDGNAVPWAPLSGPSDLPCFVYRGLVLKSELAATVRMETPVLYFYAPRPMTLDVHVAFTNGQITEWYPQAWEPDGTTGGRIAWRVDAMPAGINSVAPQLPSTQGASHYFAARNTDSDTLRAGSQTEKMIFYRGAGIFSIPIRAKFNGDGQLEIRASVDPIPLAVLFENHGGRSGYRTIRNLKDAMTAPMPELTGNLDGPAIGGIADRDGPLPQGSAGHARDLGGFVV